MKQSQIKLQVFFLGCIAHCTNIPGDHCRSTTTTASRTQWGTIKVYFGYATYFRTFGTIAWSNVSSWWCARLPRSKTLSRPIVPQSGAVGACTKNSIIDAISTMGREIVAWKWAWKHFDSTDVLYPAKHRKSNSSTDGNRDCISSKAARRDPSWHGNGIRFEQEKRKWTDADQTAHQIVVTRHTGSCKSERDVFERGHRCMALEGSQLHGPSSESFKVISWYVQWFAWAADDFMSLFQRSPETFLANGPLGMRRIRAAMFAYMEEFGLLVQKHYGHLIEGRDCSQSLSCLDQLAYFFVDAFFQGGGISITSSIFTGMCVTV